MHTSLDHHNDLFSRTYLLLKVTFGLVPIVAGLDKFLNFLTDWTSYVSPALANLLPFSPAVFMMIVGVIEIVAGLIVLSRFTKSGAYIVAAWLTLIAVNLIIAGKLDIAVRDLVMAIAAFSLAQLATIRQRAVTPHAVNRTNQAANASQPVHA